MEFDGTLCDQQVMNSSHLTEVITRSHLVCPLILKIDNRALTLDEIQDSDCLWHEDKTNSSSRLVSLGNSDNLSYQGTAKITSSMCKTMIVLQNTKSNKVQLIEVGESQLQRMLPKPSMQTNYDNDGIEITVEENRAKLLRAFGSKKSNRVSDVSSRMQINYGMMSSKIENTATNIEVSLEEIQQAESSIDTCLPVCHRDAVSPDGVYILQDFLTNDELDSIEDEVSVVSQLIPFKLTGESRYTTFFMNAINNLQNKVNNDRIKILLYIDALIKFYSLSIHKSKKKNVLKVCSPWSSLVGKKILENFTAEGGPNGRIRNSTMDDKIVVHVIILVIIACESCNLKELRNHLPRVSNLRLEQMARALCLSTWDKTSWFVKLPLPPSRSRVHKKRRQ